MSMQTQYLEKASPQDGYPRGGDSWLPSFLQNQTDIYMFYIYKIIYIIIIILTNNFHPNKQYSELKFKKLNQSKKTRKIA